MIDMVVHRHKLRETLSRLCGLLMANKERVKVLERRKSISGRLRGNGAALDGQLIEAAARAGQGAAVDGDPIEGQECFDAAKVEAGEKAKRDPETAKSRALSKEDGLRGS
jgi:acetyl-CoA carboxylase carboxyl transferase subunit beta